MNSGAMKLAADAAPDSEEVAAVSEEAPLSEVLLDSELTPNSIEPLDSVEMPPDSVVEVVPDSVEVVPDSIIEVVPDSVVEIVPDSVKVVPDSVEVMPDSVIEVVPDSVVEVVLDSVEEVQCPRCGTMHAGGVFGLACYKARREARRCARCGLLHEDYDLPAMWFHLMDKFDCEVYIPDVDKLQMDGSGIFLTDEVIKKLEEHIRKQQNKDQ
jgi:hypothetical protein